MALSNEDLWQKFATSLANLVTTGKFDKEKQVICFSGTTLLVDLADADSAITNYNVYNIGNLIPQWSGMYAPGSDLIGSYSSFLNWIDLGGDPNPNLDNLLNIAAANLTAAQQNFQDQVAKAISSWNVMQKAMPDMTFAQYIREYGAVYTEAKAAQDSAQADYFKLLQKKSGVDFQSLLNAQSRVSFSGGARDTVSKNEYNMKAKVGAEAPTGSTKVLPGQNPPDPSSNLSEILLPGYNLDAAFKAAYQEWQVKSVNDQVDVGPLEVSGTSESSRFTEFGWSASMSPSIFGDFFAFFAKGSTKGSVVKSSWESTSFDLKMYFTGCQSFLIEPVPWCQLSFVRNYRDKLYPDAPEFFGEDGSLSLLPYELIIGFEPKLELKLKNEDYSELKAKFQSEVAASLSIGPFSIGKASFSTYGNKDDMDYNDETNTVTMGPIKSTMPLLLGVICAKL